MSNNNTKSAKTQKTSNPFAEGLSTSGGVSKDTRLTIEGDPVAIRDAMIAQGIRTPQIRKILGYLVALGGSATVAELDEYAVTATGSLVWGTSERKLYNQTVAKVLRTYLPAMEGTAKYGEDGKNGTLKVVSVS